MSEAEEDFCSEMRMKTKQIHDKSDKLINMKLLVVLTDLRLYGNVLLDFYHVFLTIEQCVSEHSDHPVVGGLYMPKASRVLAFEKDLTFYLGTGWPALTKPSNAAKTYCDRIIEATKEDPCLLIAYSHSMYLGLLAGGQILKRIIKRTLGLSGADGLSIFEFENLSRLEIKKTLISNINAMPLTIDQKDRIINEKTRCFQMNNAIAESVEVSPSNLQRLIYLISIALLCVLFIFVLIYLLV